MVMNGFFKSPSERMAPSAIMSDAAGSMWLPSAMMRLPRLRISSMPGFIRAIVAEGAEPRAGSRAGGRVSA